MRSVVFTAHTLSPFVILRPPFVCISERGARVLETVVILFVLTHTCCSQVLQHVLRYKKIAPISHDEGMARRELAEGDAAKLNVYTGETV